MNTGEYCYRYDGSFPGFLSCVFAAYRHKETPACFLTFDDETVSLFPEREVPTDEEHAARVFRALGEKVSTEARALVEDGFLTCLPEREVHLYRFIALGLERGPKVMLALTDDRVNVLNKAAGHARREAQLYLGFVRFSQNGPVLVAEIEPKNRVLPMIQHHFCDRYPGELFVIYDRTHREALLSEPGRWVIAPLEDFTPAPPDEAERAYRKLWRRFYDTVAIEGRLNPRCRMTHLPKRYWGMLTEFQTESEPDKAEAARPSLRA